MLDAVCPHVQKMCYINWKSKFKLNNDVLRYLYASAFFAVYFILLLVLMI